MPRGRNWQVIGGERAFGCGRWVSAYFEASRSYVRSLNRAPLRGGENEGGGQRDVQVGGRPYPWELVPIGDGEAALEAEAY